jgi:hypothetical protein
MQEAEGVTLREGNDELVEESAPEDIQSSHGS